MCTGRDFLDYIKEKGTVTKQELFEHFEQPSNGNNYKKINSLVSHGCVQVVKKDDKTFITAI
jgi:hypothetical protein